MSPVTGAAFLHGSVGVLEPIVVERQDGTVDADGGDFGPWVAVGGTSPTVGVLGGITAATQAEAGLFGEQADASLLFGLGLDLAKGDRVTATNRAEAYFVELIWQKRTHMHALLRRVTL